MKKKFLALTFTSLAVLTSCGNAPESIPESINFHIELWPPYFEKTSNGHCKGTDSNYENNAPITLVGPDDAEISTGTFSYGLLQKSTQDESSVTNFPKSDICYFEVTFTNVPAVATYRVKTRDGQIDSVSFSRSDVISRNYSMGELWGADFKQ